MERAGFTTEECSYIRKIKGTHFGDTLQNRMIEGKQEEQT